MTGNGNHEKGGDSKEREKAVLDAKKLAQQNTEIRQMYGTEREERQGCRECGNIKQGIGIRRKGKRSAEYEEIRWQDTAYRRKKIH